MRLTVRKRYAFGQDHALVGEQLVRPEAWDALRLQSNGPFSAPADRATLERLVDGDAAIRDRAQAIDTELRRIGAETLASYGVGTGLVEAALVRLAPARPLTLSEYAPGTVHRLTTLFPDATVERVDLLCDHPMPADAHLFHRIDTDLDDPQWRGVFARFAGQTVVLVAGDTLGLRSAYAQLRGRLSGGTSDAGWLRTRSAFEALWRGTHRSIPTRFADHDGWMLEPLHDRSQTP